MEKFSLDSIHSHSSWQIFVPAQSPALPYSQRPGLPSGSLAPFVDYLSMTKATPWLVLSLLGPPGYNHRLFMCSLYHSLHLEEASPRRCSENAVDGPADWPTYSCTCVAYEIPSSISIPDLFSLTVCIFIYSLPLIKSDAYEESVISWEYVITLTEKT